MRFPAWVPPLVSRVARRAGLDVVRYHHDVHVVARRMRLIQDRRIDLIFDIGANEGQYATDLRRTGYTGRIVSFEPLSSAFAKLSARCAGDAGWSAVNAGIGDRAGKAVIHIAGNSQSSSLLPMLETHKQSAPGSETVGTEEIVLETLAGAVAQHARTDERLFVKIDAQGYEERIVASGGDAMARIIGFQLEMSLTPLYEGEKLLADMIKDMERRGFLLMSLEPGYSDPASGRLLQADGLFFRDH
jgi:FkbM family methyltransferase